MSILQQVPSDCVQGNDITPAMRQWMQNALIDAIGFDNAIALLIDGMDSRDTANLLVDGSCQVAQGAFANLSTAPTFGSVDMWAVWASGGAVTAGVMSQSTALAGASTLFALAASGITLTGAGQVSVRQRIESSRARGIQGATGSFSCLVRHGNPAAVNVTVILRTPTAADNWGASTVIYTSPVQSVPGSTLTQLGFPSIPMGACSNGIEIEVQYALGACTGSFVQLTDAQLVRSAFVPTYVPRAFDDELRTVQRYFQKSFPYATPPAQNSNVFNGMLNYQAWRAGAVSVVINLPMIETMRAIPGFIFYNPQGTNSKWRNRSLLTDSGAPAATAVGESYNGILNPQVAGDALDNTLSVHWTADARL